MDIAVLGAGAMGSVYGAFLASQPENNVTLIDIWREHIEAINAKGLTINTPEGDMVVKNLTAVTSALDLKPQDLVIIFVKATVTEEAMRQAANLVGPSTIALTLQNGLGNIEKLCRVVDPKRVVGGINSYGSSMKGPGEVILRGRGETVFGEIDGSQSERLSNLKKVFDKAGLPSSVTTNVQGRIWTKLISNIAINAPCAILGIKNGRLLEHPESVTLLEGAVTEAVAVGKAMGIIFETDDPIQYAKKVIDNTGENVCSMLQDIRAKRQTEIAVINGAIVEGGFKHGIPTPINMVLTNLVKVIQENYPAK
ncbi:MAG: 2-dehydropantoate 2-reductase [Deltaproteobacteria bacterium]|jgi:2-dehydropantoate 2-reductase|nr:2-dehydropantoate 2-reductase [Deltaproteobacteria bacterium]